MNHFTLSPAPARSRTRTLLMQKLSELSPASLLPLWQVPHQQAPATFFQALQRGRNHKLHVAWSADEPAASLCRGRTNGPGVGTAGHFDVAADHLEFSSAKEQ